VIAGDIFDKAVVDSRLINFASEEVPYAYAVAGNHDLPYHNIQNMPESAYGSLIRMKRIVNISDTIRLNVGGVSVALHGFYFGRPFVPCVKQADIDVAVVHHYIWAARFGYKGVQTQYHLDKILEQLHGYDWIVAGDNHIPFQSRNLVNCGSFYRRAKGHEEFQPVVALIFKDDIEFVSVPIQEDIITVREKKKKEEISCDFAEFFQSLRDSESLVCDVDDLLKSYLVSRKVTKEVSDVIAKITHS